MLHSGISPNSAMRGLSSALLGPARSARCCTRPAASGPRCIQRGASGITRLGTDDPRMSRVVVHGGTVYISGQTDTTAADIEGQTANVLAKVDTLLAQGGTDKSRLLTASIWVKDIGEHFRPMNEVWSAWVDPRNKPVRATVQAEMSRPAILVEIQVTAALRDQ